MSKGTITMSKELTLGLDLEKDLKNLKKHNIFKNRTVCLAGSIRSISRLRDSTIEILSQFIQYLGGSMELADGQEVPNFVMYESRPNVLPKHLTDRRSERLSLFGVRRWAGVKVELKNYKDFRSYVVALLCHFVKHHFDPSAEVRIVSESAYQNNALEDLLPIIRLNSAFKGKLVKIYGNYKHSLLREDIAEVVKTLGGIVQKDSSTVPPDIVVHGRPTNMRLRKRMVSHLIKPSVRHIDITDVSQWVTRPMDALATVETPDELWIDLVLYILEVRRAGVEKSSTFMPPADHPAMDYSYAPKPMDESHLHFDSSFTPKKEELPVMTTVPKSDSEKIEAGVVKRLRDLANAIERGEANVDTFNIGTYLDHPWRPTEYNRPQFQTPHRVPSTSPKLMTMLSIVVEHTSDAETVVDSN